MKASNTYSFKTKPKTLKQWLHKYDTWVLVFFAVATISIFYLP